MNKPTYQHAKWAVFVKDLTSGQVLSKLNTQNLFIPASSSKLFSVAALLNTYGEDYSIRTPVYSSGKVTESGVLEGNLILVGKGDLVLGGRALPGNRIAYTNFDHIDANGIPGAILTPQDPLAGIQSLARQVKKSGIKIIDGDILIDDSLFKAFANRENIISPIMINENLFDFEVKPGKLNKPATIMMRPKTAGMKVINKVITVEKGKKSDITITADSTGEEFEVTGTIAADMKSLVNTYTMEHPKVFARSAFIEALQKEGIEIRYQSYPELSAPQIWYRDHTPVASLSSPSMLEFSRLILKVSHNMGANLIPMLLAIYHNKTTYADGMRYIGDFVKNKVHLTDTEISFGDAAGGDANYVTPEAMMKLLSYFHSLPQKQFKDIIYTLPILGVDGSLTNVANHTPSQGQVFAKTGTGIGYNMLFGNYLLTSKALAGYFQNKDKHWIAFFVVVNQGNLPQILDVLEVNNDLGLMVNAIYEGWVVQSSGSL